MSRKPINLLIILIATLCLVCALSLPFTTWLESLPIEQYIGLSWWGLTNFYLWQPVTEVLFFSTGSRAFDIDYILFVGVELYIFWLVKEKLAEFYTELQSVLAFFIIAVTTGLFTLFVSVIFGFNPLITGPTLGILGLAMIWAIRAPDDEILLFLLIPVQAKWILAILLALVGLPAILKLDFPLILKTFFGVTISYLYAVVYLNRNSPFTFLEPIEKKIYSLRKLFHKPGSKVVDLSTRQAFINDDLFVDQMLEKISKQGEQSLTWSERSRLNQISNKKSNR